MTNDQTVRLVGLDVGSTTSSTMMVRARIVRNCVTGRMELGDLVEEYRATPEFTPFVGDRIDISALGAMIDRWICEWGGSSGDVAAGGAIVTGLAAQCSNAAAVAELVRSRFNEVLIATADDPCLESWLAFMGNCLDLSRSLADVPVVNLDIGGGTTNLAWGTRGQVKAVGCYSIAARHVQVVPGMFQIVRVSEAGQTLLDHLGIGKGAGDELTSGEVSAIVDWYVAALEAIVAGAGETHAQACLDKHTQIPFSPPSDGSCVITFSGGVGELIYRHSRGEALPLTTAYGDLGIELARRVCASTALSRDLQTHVPLRLGRATLHGLTACHTEVSGASLYLPRPSILPLRDLPIVGRVDHETTDEQWSALLLWAGRGARGGCFELDVRLGTGREAKAWGARLATLLDRAAFPADRTLVVLLSDNAGKTLGHYATRWGVLDVNLVVVDEVPTRSAQFAAIGHLSEGIVSVTYYGFGSSRHAPRAVGL